MRPVIDAGFNDLLRGGDVGRDYLLAERDFVGLIVDADYGNVGAVIDIGMIWFRWYLSYGACNCRAETGTEKGGDKKCQNGTASLHSGFEFILIVIFQKSRQVSYQDI